MSQVILIRPGATLYDEQNRVQGVLDIPLSERGRSEVARMAQKLSRSLGITFVVVTHELPSIYAIADRVIMLDKRVKKIVATGKPAELRDTSTNPWVRQFFNRQAEVTEVKA